VRRALLDTDIFSEVAKGKNEFVRRRALTYMSTVGPLAISTATVVEVVKGFRKVGREREIDRFLASLPKLEVFALDTVAAEHAGRIYGDLERVGQPIGRADPHDRWYRARPRARSGHRESWPLRADHPGRSSDRDRGLARFGSTVVTIHRRRSFRPRVEARSSRNARLSEENVPL
jgi:tRNA(fMet)-specific endonuclease VapC